MSEIYNPYIRSNTDSTDNPIEGTYLKVASVRRSARQQRAILPCIVLTTLALSACAAKSDLISYGAFPVQPGDITGSTVTYGEKLSHIKDVERQIESSSGLKCDKVPRLINGSKFYEIMCNLPNKPNEMKVGDNNTKNGFMEFVEEAGVGILCLASTGMLALGGIYTIGSLRGHNNVKREIEETLSREARRREEHFRKTYRRRSPQKDWPKVFVKGDDGKLTEIQVPPNALPNISGKLDGRGRRIFRPEDVHKKVEIDNSGVIRTRH